MENSLSGKKEMQVDIFGKTYTLMYDGDQNHLKTVASYVDEKMKTISSSTSMADSFKVAVLAALQITEDLFNVKKELTAKIEVNEAKTSEILDMINSNFKEIG